MSSFVIKNANVFYNAQDITGFLNSVAMNYESGVQENTVLGVGTRSRVAGLLDGSIDIAGYFEADSDSTGDPDLSFFGEIGSATKGVISVAPDTANEGDRAYVLLCNQGSYNIGGTIGEVAPFNISLPSSGPIMRGILGANGQKTASGNTTSGFTLPALGANDKLIASAHIIHNGGSTPTIDIIVVSDDDGTFGAGTTTRITFAQVTTTSSFQRIEVTPGVVADTDYRVEWTLGGGSPDYNIFVVVGVVPYIA
jgi:hypothetical protein